MLPRPRQTQFVEKAHTALKQHGNTLGIATTGFGKTVALGFIANRYKGNQLILQHRDELVKQNSETYAIINPKRKLGFVDGNRKRPAETTFAMFQSMAANHDLIPDKLSLIVVDEAHHIIAPTYREVVDIALDKSPKAHLLGVTATPRRGMGDLFTNVADHVTLREMMAVGLLTPLKSYACTTPKTRNELDALGSVSNTGDQHEVAHVLDNENINEEVFTNWRKYAHDRRTIVFCSSVDHATHVSDYFNDCGINSAVVHGNLSRGERRDILDRLDHGDIQVVCNVFVLTEGFDSPPVSCAILLRQCSELGPLVQMVGRILRTHPGKQDAILLDFGTSILTHGTLEQDAELLPTIEGEAGVGVTKYCPEIYGDTHAYRFPDANGKTGCGAELPANTRTCPLCGFLFDRIGHTSDSVPVELTEVDLLNASPFRYVDLFGDGNWLMASGFGVWSLVGCLNGVWYAIGGRDKTVDRLFHGSKLQAIAAGDDFMRVYSTESKSKKAAFWQTAGASKKQVDILHSFGYCLEMNVLGECASMDKYTAACHISFRFNSNKIKSLLLCQN